MERSPRQLHKVPGNEHFTEVRAVSPDGNRERAVLWWCSILTNGNWGLLT